MSTFNRREEVTITLTRSQLQALEWYIHGLEGFQIPDRGFHISRTVETAVNYFIDHEIMNERVTA